MGINFKSNIPSITAAFMVASSGFAGYMGNHIDDSQAYYNNLVKYKASLTRTSFINECQSLPISFSKEVSACLDKDMVLAGNISIISYKLSEYFPGCRAVAEVISDFENDSKALKISVVDEDDVDSMLEKLNKFDSDWWMNSSAYKTGNIIVDVMAI